MTNQNLKPGVFTYLDCSTVHITPEDDQYLKQIHDGSLYYDMFPTPIMVYNLPNWEEQYGYWIRFDDVDYSISPALHQLKTFTESRGCQWIRLDRDGTIHEDLPQYTWK